MLLLVTECSVVYIQINTTCIAYELRFAICEVYCLITYVFTIWCMANYVIRLISTYHECHKLNESLIVIIMYQEIFISKHTL